MKQRLIIAVLVPFLFALSACTSMHNDRPVKAAGQCPLSQLTEIEASGDNPRALAFQMAANAAVRAGHDRFSVLRHNDTPESCRMLIRTQKDQQIASLYPVYLTGDILRAPSKL